MRALLFYGTEIPLKMEEVPIPKPLEDEVLIKVFTCGVCRTDLHIIDGELNKPKLPLILGHQIVGEIVEVGKNVKNRKVGQRIGVPWLGKSCGKCDYCLRGKENLCDFAQFTGYTRDGGFAEYATAYADFTFPIPDLYSNEEAAPLLCPGLIGFRALRLTEGAKKIGFYGFGVSAHILIQVINYQGGEVYSFSRNPSAFAKELGAKWVGKIYDIPPEPLDAALIFAPVGELYVQALKVIKKGGIVVSAGIHMSDIPSFPYRLLWEERMIRSVANLTRNDGREFLELAPQIPIKTTVTVYPLEKGNVALKDQREGKLKGAAVLKIR